MGHRHVDKKCGECREWKPVGEFYPSRRGTKGRDGYCKNCRRNRDRARASKRNAVVLQLKAKDPLYFRRKKLLKLYGITCEQYTQMLELQGGLCALCRKPEVRQLYGVTAHLVVDHCHVTNRVRALLCHRCNINLAVIENTEFVNLATRYLENYGP